MLGKIELWNGNVDEAYYNFNKAQSIFGCAYCKFLKEELKEAKILLNLIKNSSPAVNWLICLIEIVEEDLQETPSYFQIRNFYEQDLNMLFEYKKEKFVKNIINQLPLLEYYNREIYKYTARVMKNYNYTDWAIKFLKKSLDICYKDPETHYLLGEIYLKQNDIEKAKKFFTNANEATGCYLPAQNMLKVLTN